MNRTKNVLCGECNTTLHITIPYRLNRRLQNDLGFPVYEKGIVNFSINENPCCQDTCFQCVAEGSRYIDAQGNEIAL